MFAINTRRLRLQLCLLTTTALFTTVASGDILRLEDTERVALERDASLTRIAALADARAADAVADGALPDPELTFGVQNLPARSLSMTEDMMTMSMVGVRQVFPPGKTRRLAREGGELEARALRAEFDDRALEIRLEVRRAWLEWRYAHDALALASEAEADFADLVDITERRFATGSARQLDLAQARVEFAGLAERVIELEAARDTATAELARWLGEPLDATRVPGEVPAWPSPDIMHMRDSLPSHPALVAPELRVEAGRVGTEIARQAFRPKWMAEVSYGFRAGDDPVMGGAKSDMVSGMVSISVPLFTGGRQDRRLEAALHERDAARAERVDRQRVLAGAIARNHARWQRLDELDTLFRERLLPDAEDARTAALDAYRSGRASFDELVRAQVSGLDAVLRALGVARQRDDARIELLYLAGE